MKKITLLFIAMLALSFQAYAQHNFSTVTGPENVAQGSPVTLSMNTVGNAAGVPADTYEDFTVTVDWANDNNAYSEEAHLTLTTTAGSVTIDPPTSGALGSFVSTTLTFSGTLPGGSYDPSVDGFLQITLNQSYSGSNANWSNIVVNISAPLYSGPPLGVSCSSGNSSYIFTENFESDPPSGWTGTTFNGNNGNWDITTANGNSPNTGPSNAYDNGSGMHLEYEASGNSSATASAISPAIDLTNAIDDAELSFYLHAYGAAMGTLNVGVSNSASGPFTTVFTQSGQIQTTAGAAWTQFGVNLGAYVGQTIYLEFKHKGSGSNYTGDMSIDNIRVEACESSCPRPNNIVVSNITGTSADITWDAGGSETDWEIVVQSAGTGAPAGSGTSVTTNPFTNNTLSPITAYEVYVRADCDIDGYSNWEGPVNFSTPIANDDFAYATPISCGNIYTGDTTLATIDENNAPDGPNSDIDSPNLWYSFIGTGDPITLSTCANTSFDTEILVYTGASGNLTYIDEGFDECSNSTYEAETTFTSILGTHYFISIDGWNSGNTGTFELSVICTPPASVTYTFTNGSWDGNNNPDGIATSNDDVIIVSGDATISSNTTVNSVTVNPGAGLIVNTGTTLTAANGLTLESSSTSYSSLILDGIVAGTLNYERHVNINGSGTTGNNDLISPPLTGQAFDDFATANPNILNNGTLYLFGPFDKNTAEYLFYTNTETATLEPGVGYRAASSNNDTFTFTGTANKGIVHQDITNYGTHEAEWNLVGNPYPSYMNVQDFLLHEVSNGVPNLALFNAGTAAIYGYDGNAIDDWTIYNLANTTASTVIAPGQGFFVSANTTNAPLYDLEFTPDMRSTGSGDDFIVGRNAELIYVKLNISTSQDSYTTDLYFNQNASLGFDLGYDAKVWGDDAPNFAIYSHLVQDNTGDNLTLQTVNTTDLIDVTVPLGVNANQGEQLTFSIADMTLPESINVYLDDTVANTTTLLNNSDYIITPTTALYGTGRFFLRTSEDALSTIENNLDTLNIFALNSSKELVVNGQLKDNTVLNLYDIQGRLVLSTQLDTTSLENRINISNISGGIYVVNVQNNTQQKSQKVILK